MAGLREAARAGGGSLWETAAGAVKTGTLAGRAGNAVGGFLALMRDLIQALADKDLGVMMSAVIEQSQLIDHYRSREPADRAEGREENLEELVRAAETFVQPFEDEQSGLTPIASFLAQAALEAGEHQGGQWEDCVQLMTLHSAKGLEFPLVFMAGMEEGLFPHQKSIEEPGRLSEERRLAYVGMTRAMERLYLSYAESRRLHRQTVFARPSRFLEELPAELTEDIRPRLQTARARAAPVQVEGDAPALGTTVRHARFGRGTVTDLEGQGANTRIQVNFEQAGAKWLVLAYANLERLN